MIIKASSDIFGGMCTSIQAPNFACSVSTAKEGLFKGWSTQVAEGLGADVLTNLSTTLRGKILYKDFVDKSERRRCHSFIAGMIDTAGDGGASLMDAIIFAFKRVHKEGVIEAAGVGEHGFGGPFVDFDAVLAELRGGEVAEERAKSDGDGQPVGPLGKEKWKFKAERAVVSSPAISDGVVYFGSRDSYLYALDACPSA